VFTHERALKVLRYGVALAPPLPFLGGVYRLGPGDGISDDALAHERLAAARARALPLRVIGGLMFAVVFVWIPIAAFTTIVVPHLRWAFVALAILHVTALVLGWRAMKALDPKSRGARRELLLKALLSPLLSMRLGLLVPREALSRFGPLAGMKLLCPASELEPFRREKPPARRDADSRSYCPQCLAQYVRTGGSCSDCGYPHLAELES
jgi:hypothetical protein